MLIKTSVLKEKMNLIAKALVKNSIVPVVSSIAVIDGWMVATNLEMTIAVKTDLDFTALLPAKMVDIVSTLPDENTELTLTDKKLSIKSGTANFKIIVQDNVEDYPMITFPDSYDCDIDTKELNDVLKLVAFSVATEPTVSHIFHGVSLETNAGSLTVTSSDTLRLSSAVLDNLGFQGNYSAIVPFKALQEVLKFDADKTSVKFDDHLLTFKSGDLIVQSKLVMGEYPDISNFMAMKEQTTIINLTSDFSGILKRAIVLSDSTRNVVKLDVVGDVLEVKVDSEIGSLEEKVDINKQGNDVSVFINAKYLIDVLQIDGLTLYIRDNAEAIFFKKPEHDYFHVVLAIRKFS